MGQEFAFVFDIIVIATLIGMIFVGIKKGFARILIELVSLTVSIVLAFLISEPIPTRFMIISSKSRLKRLSRSKSAAR